MNDDMNCRFSFREKYLYINNNERSGYRVGTNQIYELSLRDDTY